ncbi:OmpP1/FadL family transporter [Kordia sp. SMS9]|uniref:OmpP1/FadL family transporter n=1 Tax=Kordia sp. SMS9 TaxID=2282170 RepID=UPI0013B35E1B|nr:hypothetical protein [Kordia sp. SMS9]
MKMKSSLLVLLSVLGMQFACAQSSSLSSSPYSLYGLGVPNETGVGIINALGKLGFAMPSLTNINDKNPASLGRMTQKSFLFDVGIKAQRETVINSFVEETRFNANFSNISLAFPISEKSGVGITLIPFTNVGYVLLGIETNIEGTTDTFFTNVNGAGGLNDFKFSYGYSVTDSFRVGASGSILFGTIDETETNFIDDTALIITEENHYSGFRFDVGLQYDWSERTSFGLNAKFPTLLNGSQSRTIETLGTATITTREEDNNLPDFELPLEVGFGFISNFLTNKLTINADYQHSFWDSTDQRDYLGEYVDQHQFGMGLSYRKNGRALKYWDRIFYRVGFNYDSGNLKVNDYRVENYTLSTGVGLPISSRTNSMLNISYSYGQKGRVSNGLIQENFHLLTLNFSFDGKWFVKRRYD